MKYELWFSSIENSYELVPENADPVLAKLRAADSVRVLVFEADSWDEARRKKFEYLGLGEDGADAG